MYSSPTMCQVKVYSEGDIRCSCGFYKDDLTPEQVEEVAVNHAEWNRPSAIQYVEIGFTKLYP